MKERQLTALVVDPLLDQLMSKVCALTTAGFDVTAADGFVQAKPLVGVDYPRILVTAARLGLYNGLHLVLRGKGLQPNLAALVTSDLLDPILQGEVESLGATFVVTPIPTAHLVAAILQTLYRQPHEGPVRPPFERRVADRRVSVVALHADRRLNERRRLIHLNPTIRPSSFA